MSVGPPGGRGGAKECGQTEGHMPPAVKKVRENRPSDVKRKELNGRKA